MLRPGGRLGILEITTPRGPLAPFYRVWFDRVVPLLGKVLPGGAAYTYLPASVRRFPAPDDARASCSGEPASATSGTALRRGYRGACTWEERGRERRR